MRKHLFVILFLSSFLCSVLGGYAQDRTILVTPVQVISTCKKGSLQEGDYVKFKVLFHFPHLLNNFGKQFCFHFIDRYRRAVVDIDIHI